MQRLVERQHADDQVLIIGQYLDQLDLLSRGPAVLSADHRAHADQGARAALRTRFRRGRTEGADGDPRSGNFAVDLPDANVAIQVSGTFGSRQEEAQRLGRILRPKSRPPAGDLLLARHARQPRGALRQQPAAVPHRTGLHLRDPRRRRRVARRPRGSRRGRAWARRAAERRCGRSDGAHSIRYDATICPPTQAVAAKLIGSGIAAGRLPPLPPAGPDHRPSEPGRWRP